MSESLDVCDVATTVPDRFHDIIQFWASRTPDAPAFLTETGDAWTYSALVAAIDRIGTSLNAAGFGRNDRIAIFHPGGADLAAAILGIWSHATAIPLSPDLRLGELAVYIRDLRVDAIAIASGLENPARIVAKRLGLPVLELTRTSSPESCAIQLLGPQTQRAAITGRAQGNDIALVLMTSGTTSESKIVPIQQSLIVERCHDGARLLALTAADRGASMMQLHHWGGIGSIIYALYAGSCVAFFPGQDLRHIFHCLETLAPTYIAGPYTVFHAILSQHERLKEAIHTIRPRLRMLRTGAGHLDPRVAEKLEILFGVPVIQAYGSSETAFMACDPFPPKPRKAGSVGLLGNSQIAIMDDHGQRLPAHREGEVLVSGPKVFGGYENNPVANAESFVDGWFRIGDMGYFDEDGYLFLTGRIKEIINRGGQKIMPGEIDAAITAHPGVSAAVAFPVPHPTLGDDVAAAVVLKPDAVLDKNALTEFLRTRLADTKIPRQIVFIDEIPKGHTGKIQRYKLAAVLGLDRTAETLSGTDRPATPLEARLREIWAETLQMPTVPLDRDFFTLGGDSLQAVDLFLRIEEDLGRRLPRSVLFEASTVAEMAGRIASSSPSHCVVPIQPAGSAPIFFAIHDVNGEVLNFRRLAHHLGADQPFYGLQSVGLDGCQPPLTRIEEMATRYISEIRNLQPTGPYYLGGYSMGGLIAYEMARQLRALGEPVAMLALFDTLPPRGKLHTRFFGPSSPLSHPYPQTVAPSRFTLVRLAIRVIAQDVRTALSRRLFGAMWRSCEIFGVAVPRFLYRPIAANLLAIRSYRMKPYAGDAILFKAKPYEWEQPNQHDGWKDMIGGGLEVHSIPGQHHEILEEQHATDLANILSTCLRARQKRYARSSDETPSSAL